MSKVPVTGFVDQAVIDSLVLKQVEKAIADELANSAVIKKAVQVAVTSALPVLDKSIATAMDKATTQLLSDSTFIAKLIGEALIKDSSKLKGAFDSALRAAGKRMALDSGTLEELIETITEKYAIEAAVRAAEMAEKGGGQFS